MQHRKQGQCEVAARFVSAKAVNSLPNTGYLRNAGGSVQQAKSDPR